MKGRSIRVPGSFIPSAASNVPRSTAICPAASPGFPRVRAEGYSIPTNRGAGVEAVRSGMLDRHTVEIPAASIFDATSPTDQLQRGHTGTRRARSTWSSARCSIMAGTDFSKSSEGSMVYPMKE